MPVQPFPFITDGSHGDVPINFYPAADSEAQIILYGSPGLDSICTLPYCTEIRAMAAPFDDYLYVAARRGNETPIWRVSGAGTFAEIGMITTSSSGPLWIMNNATQICFVDGVTGYVFTPATGSFVQITDPDFPGAGGCDYQDGYGLFFKPSSNQWFFSSLFDFKAFDALDFYTKESKPGNIIGLVSFMREPWIFGGNSAEVWYNAGGDNSSVNTPTFARNTGGVVPYGLGAAGTVLPEARGNPRTALRWLTKQGQMVQSAGYNAKAISNQMFERATKAMSTYSDAVSFDYQDQGHEFTQITFPTADQTWVYDGSTKFWHKKQSYLDAATGFGRHRANCYARLGTKHYVGDYSNGKIYEMSTDYYDDDGEEIQRIVYSKEFYSGMERISFPNAQILTEPGVGLESGLDPQIMLQFSQDFGKTWSNEVWRSSGQIGEYYNRAIWTQQGSGYYRMYRAMFADPVLWRIIGISWGAM